MHSSVLTIATIIATTNATDERNGVTQMAAQYKIVSLRAQANGFKQRDIKSAGKFTSYEDALKAADKMNEKNDRIYTTYSAIKTFDKD